jgi:hypothetical protein
MKVNGLSTSDILMCNLMEMLGMVKSDIATLKVNMTDVKIDDAEGI